MHSLTSVVLAAGILAFIGIASAMLVWDGLAQELGRGDDGRAARWRSRAKLATGVLGLAFALWLGLGLMSHAW